MIIFCNYYTAMQKLLEYLSGCEEEIRWKMYINHIECIVIKNTSKISVH